MAIKSLTNLDGSLSQMIKGTVIVGDASTPLADGFYIAKTIAGSSTLPTNTVINTPFFGDATITPAVGDDVMPITFEKLCDIQSATFDVARDKIETTTLCDKIKKYKVGRADFTGELSGITKLGITDKVGGLINNFVKIITQTSDLSAVTISEVDSSPVYLQLEINKVSTAGEPTAFYLMPVLLENINQGVPADGAQVFTAAYSITEDDDIEFALFELEQPVV